MATEIFQKNRYIFSTRRTKREPLDEEKLVKQLRLFKKELKLYDIKLKHLYSDVPSIERKNLILNISRYICDRKKILAKIKKIKKIPVWDVAFETGVKETFIRKYKYYILAYMLLFSNDSFSEIVKYLKIEFRELDELSLVPVVDNTERNLLKGLALRQYGSKVVILTDQGEFIRIVDNDQWQIANEAVGKEYIGLKKHRKKIIIATPIILIATILFSYFYNFTTSTVLIKATSEIKIEMNKFKRVVSVYSPTEKGEILVKSLNLKNKDIDSSIAEILEYLDKNKMMPENNSLQLAVTGEALNFNEFNKINELMDGQSSKENKYKLVVNNVGSEVILKPGK